MRHPTFVAQAYSRSRKRLLARPSNSTVWSALIGGIFGALAALGPQWVMAERTATLARIQTSEDRLWHERVAAYSAFESAVASFLERKHITDEDARHGREEAYGSAIGRVLLLGGPSVRKAARDVALLSLFRDSPLATNVETQWAQAEEAFRLAAALELGVTDAGVHMTGAPIVIPDLGR